MNFMNSVNFRKVLFYVAICSSLLFSGCSLNGNASYLRSALSEKTREEALRSALSQLEGVEGISVFLWGRTALIGYSAEKDAAGEDLADMIKAKALETDGEIEYVAVSRNPGIMKRIEKLN